MKPIQEREAQSEIPPPFAHAHLHSQQRKHQKLHDEDQVLFGQFWFMCNPTTLYTLLGGIART